jgi:hypothetical protein
MASKENFYRQQAENCLSKSLMAENFVNRSHWLQAAMRWFYLAREERVLRSRQTKQSVGPAARSTEACAN